VRIKFDVRLRRPLHVTTGGAGHKRCPVIWPWWKLFAVHFVQLSGILPPSTGYALWIYTRPNAGRYIDVYIDRRKAK
jgi:hypothetical protein